MKLSSPHGVRGEIKASCILEDPLLLKKFTSLQDESAKTYTLTSVRSGTKGRVLVKLKDTDTPEDAAHLRGLCLYGPRELLPALSEEEFYHQDLLGMRAAIVPGEQVLTVIGVYNFGAGDILELAQEPPQKATFMVPLRKEAVLEIDIKARTLKIEGSFLISDKAKD